MASTSVTKKVSNVASTKVVTSNPFDALNFVANNEDLGTNGVMWGRLIMRCQVILQSSLVLNEQGLVVAILIIWEIN